MRKLLNIGRQEHWCVRVIAWLVTSWMPLATGATADEWPKHFHFSVKRGTNHAVCTAYAKALEAAEFMEWPYCSRPEPAMSFGFDPVERKALDDSEVRNLFPRVNGFITYGNVEHYEQTFRKPARGKRSFQERMDEEIKTPLRFHHLLGEIGRSPLYSRIIPDVDIDSDGEPDRLLAWTRGRFICGSDDGRGPERTDTYLVALDAQGKLDAPKTSRLFGASTPRHSRSFNAFAPALGILKYKGVAYIDSSSAISNDSTTDLEVIRVFRSTPTKREEICEIHWSDVTDQAPY